MEATCLSTSDSSLSPDESGGQWGAESSSTSVELLTELVPTSRDLLRATRAAVPLECFGAVLRECGGGNVALGATRDLYSRSYCTEHFHEFWSHSWHGPVWPKVITLLFFYNSPAAIVVSFAAAAAGASLQFLWATSTVQAHAGLLSFCPGCLGFFLTLAFWRSGRCVFLDSVCICQTDADLKMKGIWSLGGFLRHSRSMLILWDPSYCSRLWCVFEQAAFFYLCTEDSSKHVYFRPTLQVTAWLMVFLTACVNALIILAVRIFLGWSIVGMYSTALCIALLVLAKPLRRILREINMLPKQLESFTMERAECFCCTHGHRHPVTHDELPCDRLLVEASVRQWFGSTERFSHFVRTHVRQLVGVQCEAPPYRMALLWAMPRLWWSLGFIARHLIMDDELVVLKHLVVDAYWTLFLAPLAVEAVARTVWCLRESSSHCLMEAGKYGAVVLLGGLLDELNCIFVEYMKRPVQVGLMHATVGAGLCVATALVYGLRLFK